MTAQFWILGFPVKHSLSPAMHNAAFAQLGIDARYGIVSVEPQALAETLLRLRREHLAGANVTVPHKEAVMAWLDEVEPAAAAIGAVNTIVREGDRLIGHNTDARGLVASLMEASVALAGAHVVVLGAGGAARAAVVGLGRAGATQITIASRREGDAVALANELATESGARLSGVGFASDPATLLSGGSAENLRGPLSTATLLVQATSATLASDPFAPRFAQSIPIEALRPDAVVIDLVYKPRVTTLMQRAQDRGLRTVDGLGMLLHQGAIAFQLWTKREAPIDVMRQALESALLDAAR